MAIKSTDSKSSVQYITIARDEAGQRIDNFLVTKLKGVPKTRIYRILRKGEVRVNKKRVAASYRLLPEDAIRIPPLYLATRGPTAPPSQATMLLLKDRILYENEQIIVINKPSGMSVHVGSTVRMGVIEAMRHAYPHLRHLELAHRLDTETSGCLVLAKKRSVLKEIHGLLREGQVRKTYLALTQGKWEAAACRVDLPLHKHYRDGGKHVVTVHPQGKTALTIFEPLETYRDASLMRVQLMTGRTHQIRVHAAHQGHPIAGDDRYGDRDFNAMAASVGLKRLFLHASIIEFVLPSSGQHIKVEAPLDSALTAVLEKLGKRS